MLMGLEFVILAGVIIWGIRQGWFQRLGSPQPRGVDTYRETTALDILDERFARGEITADEFRERRIFLERQHAAGD